MKAFVAILVTGGIFFSCSHKEKKAPGILPENKMRTVMWDMIRADQYATDFIIKDSLHTKKDTSLALYAEIFRIHKISAGQFKKSLDYYGSRPDFLRPLLDSLAKKQKTTPPGQNHSLVDSLSKKQKTTPPGQTHPFVRDTIKSLPGKQPKQ